MSCLLVWLASAIAAPALPDTLVVCPAEFRAALEAWEDFRRQQGHTIAFSDVPASAGELSATIRHFAAAGTLKYVVIVGDVPIGRELAEVPQIRIPTNYLPARINRRWGSESHIATDLPFADIDGDRIPDLALGRIPADRPAELAAVVRKILRYEQQPDDAQDASWQRRLHVVAGMGGFGVVADALIEATCRQVIQEHVPAGYEVKPTLANPKSPHFPPPGDFTPCVCRQFETGCLAWIYLGHGRPCELDRVVTPRGAEPILSVADVPRLRCGAHSPLAVLLACYTGALDAREDCLAEELLLADDGPVAVIAATRVTMPYGNCVFGCELLRACFSERTTAVGDLLRLAQSRTLEKPGDADALRAAIDSLAENVSPPPVELEAERREHVWMYHLLGDPLLKLRVPSVDVAAASDATVKK
jgi:hypothetical protein